MRHTSKLTVPIGLAEIAPADYGYSPSEAHSYSPSDYASSSNRSYNSNGKSGSTIHNHWNINLNDCTISLASGTGQAFSGSVPTAADRSSIYEIIPPKYGPFNSTQPISPEYIYKSRDLWGQSPRKANQSNEYTGGGSSANPNMAVYTYSGLNTSPIPYTSAGNDPSSPVPRDHIFAHFGKHPQREVGTWSSKNASDPSRPILSIQSYSGVDIPPVAPTNETTSTPAGPQLGSDSSGLVPLGLNFNQPTQRSPSLYSSNDLNVPFTSASSLQLYPSQISAPSSPLLESGVSGPDSQIVKYMAPLDYSGFAPQGSDMWGQNNTNYRAAKRVQFVISPSHSSSQIISPIRSPVNSITYSESDISGSDADSLGEIHESFESDDSITGVGDSSSSAELRTGDNSDLWRSRIPSSTVEGHPSLNPRLFAPFARNVHW
ncbi:uncharacterized protein I303_100021 [Kwoniella dejecticola CBS 10117]|uniref:Uncharacterized protein n=1 Tax=Kwoniella dejecticola CBS 10117 TaxID=1296121 RepID=A0A1A6ADR9_9TREE|nr:uncharacterized protein I303_00021 [Kwoniella dejecticola CBS 10117]OBR88210.1 hypothetical protein I303_00021 [Kwoniella dejecticola CBS 10117]